MTGAASDPPSGLMRYAPSTAPIAFGVMGWIEKEVGPVTAPGGTMIVTPPSPEESVPPFGPMLAPEGSPVGTPMSRSTGGTPLSEPGGGVLLPLLELLEPQPAATMAASVSAAANTHRGPTTRPRTRDPRGRRGLGAPWFKTGAG